MSVRNQAIQKLLIDPKLFALLQLVQLQALDRGVRELQGNPLTSKNLTFT